MKDLDLRCKKCDRYLNLKEVQTIISKVRCPNTKCKHLNNIKVVNNDSSLQEIKYEFDKEKSTVV